MPNRKEFTRQINEGEGNRTAAREYNEAQQRFVRSGQIDRKARESEHDLEKDLIRRELEHAEVVGARHAADEDPEVRRSYKKD
jgi:hypothetical protein